MLLDIAKRANGLHMMIPEHWGVFLVCSQSSRDFPSCSHNAIREGFMLAYHVWMDEGTTMIGAQFKTFFST